MFTPSDLAQLEARGISVEKAEKQLQSFATGFPELDIVSAASVGNGVLTPSEKDVLIVEYLYSNGRTSKVEQILYFLADFVEFCNSIHLEFLLKNVFY